MFIEILFKILLFKGVYLFTLSNVYIIYDKNNLFINHVSTQDVLSIGAECIYSYCGLVNMSTPHGGQLWPNR